MNYLVAHLPPWGYSYIDQMVLLRPALAELIQMVSAYL